MSRARWSLVFIVVRGAVVFRCQAPLIEEMTSSKWSLHILPELSLECSWSLTLPFLSICIQLK